MNKIRPYLRLFFVYLNMKLQKNILFLTIKEPYFSQIKKGIKTFEYRTISGYWEKKFKKNYDFILFQNGYRNNSPRLLIELLAIEIHTLQDKNELFKNEIELFALKLGEQLQIENELIYA